MEAARGPEGAVERWKPTVRTAAADLQEAPPPGSRNLKHASNGVQSTSPYRSASNFADHLLAAAEEGEEDDGGDILAHLNESLPRSISDHYHHRPFAAHVLGIPYRDIRDKYSLRRELGRGRSAVVRLCVERATRRQYAVKIVSKRMLREEHEVRLLQREVQIMALLSDLPQTVGLCDFFEDEKRVYLVTELCEGGELFDRITRRKRYPEGDAAALCWNLLHAVRAWQERDVVHCDLKPENILLLRRDDHVSIKVADFGSAVFYTGEPVAGQVGSAYYIAPEVLEGSYGKEADMWSLGVILYILLSGQPPFWGSSDEVIFAAIRSGSFDTARGPWRRVSPAAKHLVRALLTSDAGARISADEALEHPWFEEQFALAAAELDSPPEGDGGPVFRPRGLDIPLAHAEEPGGGGVPESFRREEQQLGMDSPVAQVVSPAELRRLGVETGTAPVIVEALVVQEGGEAPARWQPPGAHEHVLLKWPAPGKHTAVRAREGPRPGHHMGEARGSDRIALRVPGGEELSEEEDDAEVLVAAIVEDEEGPELPLLRGELADTRQRSQSQRSHGLRMAPQEVAS